jgi:two-component system chemotaxis sensor kinase CheA
MSSGARTAAESARPFVKAGRVQLKLFALVLALAAVLIAFSEFVIAPARERHAYVEAGCGTALAITFAVCGAWLVGRAFSRRLAAITRLASAVANGDLDQEPIGDASPDDIGELARAFDVMLMAIQGFIWAHEREAGEERDRLDGIVRLRTGELADRNDAMRRLLDHVPVGLLSIDTDGRLGSECSLVASALFGSPEPDMHVWSYFAQHDASFAAKLEGGWMQLVDGVLPRELALDQLPKQLTMGDYRFRIEVLPTSSPEALEQYLMVIENMTDRDLRRAHADANLELAVSLKRFVADRAGFAAFLNDAHDLVARISGAESPTEVRQALHTLKGNALMLGFETIGEHCHCLEAFMEEAGEPPTIAQREELKKRIDRLESVFGSLTDANGVRVEIDRQDHSRLVEAIVSGKPRREVLERARTLLLEPVEVRFSRLAEQASAVARRIGRPAPLVLVTSRGIRMDRARYARFWSALTHVIRNALSHGIEPPEVRRAAGKPEVGTVRLLAFERADELVLEINDDGRGIDWAAVEARAIANGLPATTRSDLEAALFADGISTSRTVDDISGRGVGLSAVAATLHELSGSVAIDTTRGMGTTFRFTFARDSSMSSSRLAKIEARSE